MDKEALVAVSALWEEFAIVLWVHKLTLRLCLIAFGPVLASDLDFVGSTTSRCLNALTRLLIGVSCIYCVAIANSRKVGGCRLSWFNWTKSFEPLLAKLFSLLRTQIWLNNKKLSLALLKLVMLEWVAILERALETILFEVSTAARATFVPRPHNFSMGSIEVLIVTMGLR